MLFFKRRINFDTDADPLMVQFFIKQYVEVMKNTKDRTDCHMKDYLFGVVIGLGVPSQMPIEVEEEKLETKAEIKKPIPLIIHRKTIYG